MEATVQKYCMRCGTMGVRADDATHEIWLCPRNHGVIFSAALPAAAAPEKPAKGEPAKVAVAEVDDDNEHKKQQHNDHEKHQDKKK
jgi:hypothetical protein